MASTSHFLEVSEDDIENVLQSAIPEKKNQESHKVWNEDFSRLQQKNFRNKMFYLKPTTNCAYLVSNQNKVVKEK